ncbi:MAG TPA: KpsF/GutQ family sugar-phosphate isomerase [bacterium]|nr:KpsF/GutQ family sugar-phosphate isomerase [bacterium]
MSVPTARRVLTLEAQGLLEVARKVGSSFNKAVELVTKSRGRVVVTGMGKSGLVGQKIASTLSSTGTPSLVLSPAEALHGDLGMVMKSDAILALSNSGETDELKILLPLLKRIGCKIILFTGNSESSLARQADVVVNMGVSKEACSLNLSPTASSTAMMAMGDALAVALYEERGFTERDFAHFHPGGDLGRRLQLKVSEVMRKGSQIPKVSPGAHFQAIVREINDKKVGCTLVVDGKGKLSGIIVDGDLRRALLKKSDVRHWNASNLRNAQPKTIGPGLTLGEALQLMEENAIFQLIVADEKQKPIGLVHLHDLLGRGQVRLS